MDTVPTSSSGSSGSLLKQFIFVVVATLLAASLGYVAANGLKSAQATPSTQSTPSAKTARTGDTGKPICDECEKRNLPTP